MPSNKSRNIKFELSKNESDILDYEKQLHKEGKTKSFTIDEVRNHAYSQLKNKAVK
jgi:hypothetical protein